MSYKILAFFLLASVGFATIVEFTDGPTVSLFFPTEFFDEVTFFGNVTIHGWLNILSGELFVSNILAINGSSIPAIDDEFDLGNTTHRWRDLYLSNSFNVTNPNSNSSISGDLTVFGTIFGTFEGDVVGPGNATLLWKVNATHDVQLVNQSQNITIHSKNATFNNDVTIFGTLFGGSPVKVSGGINVSGNGTFDNINLLSGDAQGSLNVSGNLTVGGLINGSLDCSSIVGGNDTDFCMDNVSLSITVENNSFIINNNVTFNGTFSFGKRNETIIDGRINYTATYILINSETAPNSDQLDFIDGGNLGSIVFLTMDPTTTTSIKIKDNSGNMKLSGDFTINSIYDSIQLLRINDEPGTLQWVEIARSNNG